METKNITPEEKPAEIKDVLTSKHKVLGIARHNLLTQIGRLVRKYEGNAFVIKIERYNHPLLIKTDEFVPPKQKDQVFHETKIFLNGTTPEEINPDNMFIEDVVDILDTLIAKNAN